MTRPRLHLVDVDASVVEAWRPAFAAFPEVGGKLTLQKQTTTKTGRATTVSETLTLDASTPSTGKVTVTVTGATQSATLPAYGSCPHA